MRKTPVQTGSDTRYAPGSRAFQPQSMRYVVQFLIPALIFLGVLFVVTRKKRAQAEGDDSKNTFLLILVIGAAVAVAALFATPAYWDG